MRIVHICISGPYLDGWGYQENLLPFYLQRCGTENHVIAPIENFPSYFPQDAISAVKKKGRVYLDGDINVHRIDTTRLSTSLLVPHGMMRVLDDIRPDVIFHHNVNCTSLPIAAIYAGRHNIPLLVDNHADEINMSGNLLWISLYYKGIVRLTCQIFRKRIFKAYGVTKSRCDFLKKYYGISEHIIDFLPIGADTFLADSVSSKHDLRERYGYWDEDLIVASGGKMGIGKGTLTLLKAVHAMCENGCPVKVILFGSFEDKETEAYARSLPFVDFFGWRDRIGTLELLKISDAACWPIHHTTLAEDSISVRTPLILRKTDTTMHLIDGNGVWLKECSIEIITKALMDVLHGDRHDISLKCDDIRNRLAYKTIAEHILSDINGFGK